MTNGILIGNTKWRREPPVFSFSFREKRDIKTGQAPNGLCLRVYFSKKHDSFLLTLPRTAFLNREFQYAQNGAPCYDTKYHTT